MVVSVAPVVAAAEETAGLSEKVKAFVALAKTQASDGLSVAEFAELAVSLLRIVVSAADSVPTDGAAKKAWAVTSVALLYDTIVPLPLYLYPFRAAIRGVVLLAAAGVVESILPLVRKT